MKINKKIIFSIIVGVLCGAIAFATKVYTDGLSLQGDGTVSNPITMSKRYSVLAATPAVLKVAMDLAYPQGTYISMLLPAHDGTQPAVFNTYINATLKSKNGQMMCMDTTLVVTGDTLYTLEFNKSPYLKIVIDDSIHTKKQLVLPKNKIYYWDNMIKVGKQVALYSKYNITNVIVSALSEDSITVQFINSPTDLYMVSPRNSSVEDSLMFKTANVFSVIRYSDIDSTNIYDHLYSNTPISLKECYTIRLDSLLSFSFSDITDEIKNSNIPFKIQFHSSNGDTIPDSSYPWGDNVIYRNAYGSILVNHPIHGFSDSIYSKSNQDWVSSWDRYGLRWDKGDHKLYRISDFTSSFLNGGFISLNTYDDTITYDLFNFDLPKGDYLMRLHVGVATKSIPDPTKLSYFYKNGIKRKMTWTSSPAPIVRLKGFKQDAYEQREMFHMSNICSRLFFISDVKKWLGDTKYGLYMNNYNGQLQALAYIGDTYDWTTHRFKPECGVTEVWNNGSTAEDSMAFVAQIYCHGPMHIGADTATTLNVVGVDLVLEQSGGPYPSLGSFFHQRGDVIDHWLWGGFFGMNARAYDSFFEKGKNNFAWLGGGQRKIYPAPTHEDLDDALVFPASRDIYCGNTLVYTDPFFLRDDAYWCYFNRTIGHLSPGREYLDFYIGLDPYTYALGNNYYAPAYTLKEAGLRDFKYEYIGYIQDVIPDQNLPVLNRIWAVDSLSEKVEGGMALLKNYVPITFNATSNESPRTGDYIITHSHTISKIVDKGIATDTTYLLGGICTTPNNINLNFAQGFTFSNVQGAVTTFQGFNDTIYIKDIYGNPKSDYTQPGLIINQNGAIASYDGMGHFTTISGVASSYTNIGIEVKKDTVINGHQYLTANRAFFKKLGEEVKFWDLWGREWYWGKQNEVTCSGDEVAAFITLLDTPNGPIGVLIPCADEKYIGGEVRYSIPQEYINSQGYFFAQNIDSIHNLIKGKGKLSFDERLMWKSPPVAAGKLKSEVTKLHKEKKLPTLYFTAENSMHDKLRGIKQKSIFRKMLEFIFPFLKEKFI